MEQRDDCVQVAAGTLLTALSRRFASVLPAPHEQGCCDMSVTSERPRHRSSSSSRREAVTDALSSLEHVAPAPAMPAVPPNMFNNNALEASLANSAGNTVGTLIGAVAAAQQVANIMQQLQQAAVAPLPPPPPPPPPQQPPATTTTATTTTTTTSSSATATTAILRTSTSRRAARRATPSSTPRRVRARPLHPPGINKRPGRA